MKQILYSLVLLISISCFSQSNDSKATLDKDGNLVGVATKENFQVDPYKEEWFDYGYNEYELDQEIISKLKPLLENVSIKAFMGTWCGDSQEQIPVFYKIMDASGFDFEKLEMICVNRSKKTPGNLQKGLDIERVPTFIFFKDGKEIGRFVEYPREGVEADFLKIVSGKPYKHSYEE